MPKIYELEPHVADLIAAGEVVERPASVVKELIENSIDAGAGIITVEISAGGMTYIRVSDDGCGISPEDAGAAFMRHATSKLRGAEGLEAIGTLGFRGEALAAIAAVSRIEMLTREAGAPEGTAIKLEAGRIISKSPAGCPEGTTIIVRDLFFNTPARHKFMKTDRAEGSGVATTILRGTLSQPGVSIRFIKDGKTESHSPGDSRVDSCIYSLFGREFFNGLIEAETSYGALRVEGYVSAPSGARGNRSYQFFFCNGRPIRSKTLQAALEQAYKNTLPSGKYPSCVLYIQTKPGDVDVNVHPAKTEIKFVSDKNVFDGVYYATLGALEKIHPGTRAAPSDQGNFETASDVNDKIDMPNKRVPPGSNEKTNVSYEDSPSDTASGSKYGMSGIANINTGSDNKTSTAGLFSKDSSRQRGDSFCTRAPNTVIGQQTFEGFRTPAESYKTAPEATPPIPILSSKAGDSIGRSLRVIGEAYKTYIILEYQNSVWFIDKHAAHERIHFDALKSGDWEPMSQALITPVISRHSHEEAGLLLDSAMLLDKLGFTVESFGENALAVRRIPADIEIEDTEPVLSDICAQLTAGAAPKPARLDEIYSALACRAAIKAGKSSGVRELEVLAAKVMSGEITHCPHGRPLVFEITKTTLDRSFKRI